MARNVTDSEDSPLSDADDGGTGARAKKGGKAGNGKGSSWKWTIQREDAAALVARDDLTDEKIAEKVKTTRQTLSRWKLAPEFQKRVSEIHAEARKRIRTTGIAVIEERVKRQGADWEALQQIQRERAEHFRDAPDSDHPGVKTGRMVRKVKAVKVFEPDKETTRRVMRHAESDDDIEVFLANAPLGDFIPTKKTHLVYEYEVDTGLLAELRALESQTAKELGQHVERRELSGPGGGPIAIAGAVKLGYPTGHIGDILDDWFALIDAGQVPADVAEAVALAEGLNAADVRLSSLPQSEGGYAAELPKADADGAKEGAA